MKKGKGKGKGKGRERKKNQRSRKRKKNPLKARGLTETSHELNETRRDAARDSIQSNPIQSH